MTIEWPEKLIDSLARRRAVIIIGSGVSRNSVDKKNKSPPTWHSFLEDSATSLNHLSDIKPFLDSGDYLTACEVLKIKMDENEAGSFALLVEEEFQKRGYGTAPIHEAIYNLDASIIISPNFDDIYERYANHISNGTVKIRDHTSTDYRKYLLGGDYRLIIKMHGVAPAVQIDQIIRLPYQSADLGSHSFGDRPVRAAGTGTRQVQSVHRRALSAKKRGFVNHRHQCHSPSQRSRIYDRPQPPDSPHRLKLIPVYTT